MTPTTIMTEINARSILLIKYFVIISHSSLNFIYTYVSNAQAVENTALNIPGCAKEIHKEC